MIELKKVNFIRESKIILQDINLHMRNGEHWVILGKNGSGKTTILELINGYLFPSSGKVSVLGNLYGECDVREVRKNIGYISQSLFEKLTPSDPVWEVVATGDFGYLRFYEEIPEESKEKAVSLLRQVGLESLKDHTLGTLSQGERKKVMLARALMINPSVLIMDEPCAGLDLYERERLLASIQDLQGKPITIVYVTHHMEEIMPIFTHVALIDNGKLITAGKKQDAITSETLRQAYQVPLTIDWYNDRPWVKVI
jgi:iron complex transport system ATP-binding protein